MTPNEVLTLPAGPDLDALISRHIFGRDPYPAYGRYYEVLPRKEALGIPLSHLDGKEAYAVLEYSTSIAAAWRVVEKFLPHFRLECMEDSELCKRNPGKWHCDFWTGNGLACASAEDAPLAICRAALLTCLEEKP